MGENEHVGDIKVATMSRIAIDDVMACRIERKLIVSAVRLRFAIILYYNPTHVMVDGR